MGRHDVFWAWLYACNQLKYYQFLSQLPIRKIVAHIGHIQPAQFKCLFMSGRPTKALKGTFTRKFPSKFPWKYVHFLGDFLEVHISYEISTEMLHMHFKQTSAHFLWSCAGTISDLLHSLIVYQSAYGRFSVSKLGGKCQIWHLPKWLGTWQKEIGNSKLFTKIGSAPFIIIFLKVSGGGPPGPPCRRGKCPPYSSVKHDFNTRIEINSRMIQLLTGIEITKMKKSWEEVLGNFPVKWILPGKLSRKFHRKFPSEFPRNLQGNMHFKQTSAHFLWSFLGNRQIS